MEKFSENREAKRKRGRPRAFTPEQNRLVNWAFTEVSTERTRLNQNYFMLAIDTLWSAPNPERFGYLLPEQDAVIAGKEKIRRHTILAELGRLDAEDMLEAAEIVCREQWPTAEAVRRLRAWRLDKPILPEASSDELASQLAQTVNRYAATHDELTREVFLDAIRMLKKVADAWGDE